MASQRKPVSLWPIILVGIGLILLAGAVVVFLNNPLGPSETVAPTQVSEQIPYPEIPRVSLKDAKAAYDMKTAVFVDVRGEPYYSQGHIPGALSISGAELTNRLSELDPNQWIIPYCT